MSCAPLYHALGGRTIGFPTQMHSQMRSYSAIRKQIDFERKDCWYWDHAETDRRTIDFQTHLRRHSGSERQRPTQIHCIVSDW